MATVAPGQSLVTAFDAAADFSPVYATSSFPTWLRQLAVVYRLGGPKYRTLTASFIAVDTNGAVPPDYKIVETTLQNPPEGGSFRYSQQDDLIAGKYRVEVTADGKPWKSLDYQVVDAGPSPAPVAARNLIRLDLNQLATYSFVQAGGPGAKVSLPGVRPDEKGRLVATATYRVAGTDPLGTRVEIRRNDLLVSEEWMRLDERGLSVTQRSQDGVPVPLEPPQLVLPYPPTPGEWRWQSRDGSSPQTYRLWGPLPVGAPTGMTPGYVVFMEQRNGRDTVALEDLSSGKALPDVSVETHFAPGMGMVKQITILAAGPITLMHQEIVLKDLRVIPENAVEKCGYAGCAPPSSVGGYDPNAGAE